MLPISLLKAAEGSLIFLELKNGETFNGKLTKIDTWMNVFLTEAIRTSREGDKYVLCPEVSIRGNAVKFFRVQEGTLEKALQREQEAPKPKPFYKSNQSSGDYRPRKPFRGGDGASSSSSSAPRGGRGGRGGGGGGGDRGGRSQDRPPRGGAKPSGGGRGTSAPNTSYHRGASKPRGGPN